MSEGWKKRVFIHWNGGEHVIPDVYMGRKHALNMAADFIDTLRQHKCGVKGDITVEQQEAEIGTENWKAWNTIVVEEKT
jgi:hypothetical protein